MRHKGILRPVLRIGETPLSLLLRFFRVCEGPEVENLEARHCPRELASAGARKAGGHSKSRLTGRLETLLISTDLLAILIVLVVLP